MRCGTSLLVVLATVLAAALAACSPLVDRVEEPPADAFAEPAAISALPFDADRERGNSGAFVQDNLWTEGEIQYAVWVRPSGTAVVGKRRLPDGPWSTFDLSRIEGNPLALPTADDAHNVYAVAVDQAGYIHLAGNMHTNPLRYVRSERPEDITSWVIGRMTGSEESSMTYPVFVRRGDGTLLFLYRDGTSGDGDVYLNAWQASERRWRRVSRLLDGRASGENPYLHHVAVDGRGRIHVMYEWRAAADRVTTSDLSYARSSDGGRTWERSDGTPLKPPITHARSELALDTEASGSGLLNQGGLEADRLGRPHAAVLVDGELRHVWHDGRSWSDERVPLPATAITRPSLLTSDAGEVFVLASLRSISGSAIVWLLEVTPGREDRRQIPLRELPVDDWELNFDTRALYEDNHLRLLLPVRGKGEPGEVLDFDLARLGEGVE